MTIVSQRRKIPQAPFRASLDRDMSSLIGESKQLEKLQSQLSQFEKAFAEANRKLQKQTDQLRAEKLRSDDLNSKLDEYKRKVDLVESRRSKMIDQGCQTSAPSPLSLSVSRIGLVRHRRSIQLNQIAEEPVGQLEEKETLSESKKWSRIDTLQNVSLDFSSANLGLDENMKVVGKERVKKTSVGKVAGALMSSVAMSADNFMTTVLNDEAESVSQILAHFDRLDRGNSNTISRDTCLVLAGLVLEERGIRHFSIPKVICSRLLKSLAVNVSKISASGEVVGSPRANPVTVTLRRENATEFIRLVLEFIIEQERGCT